ncbi:MAG: phosphoserine phosphatase SerB [Actinomycetales bacterium]|nr:phosphoserine phosphatase SerB [Actinomycetales bacterium]
MPQTLLITLTGDDHPGVTAGLCEALTPFPLVIVDMEQIVVRGRLVLSVLVAIDPEHDERQDLSEVMANVRRAARQAAAAEDMDVTTVPGAQESPIHRQQRLEITVLGAPLKPDAVRQIANQIAGHGGNIDRIRRIAAYPVTAVVFEGSGADFHDLRSALSVTARRAGVDIAVQEPGLDRRGQHLIVMDVDSTLITDEVIDELAARAGVAAQVANLTEQAMAGALDFSASLRSRVELLKGLPETVLSEVRESLTLTPGARTLCRTLQRLGYRVCLVSGGFAEVIGPLADELGVDGVQANRLEIVDGVLTGRLQGPILDRRGKREALEAFATQFDVPLRRTIAIGDGANDVDMLEAAGLGVAFNGKEPARAAADAALSVPYLDSVLYLLGITREEVEEADARFPG